MLSKFVEANEIINKISTPEFDKMAAEKHLDNLKQGLFPNLLVDPK